MNHCVPDFQLDGDGYSIPALPRQKKSQLADEQVMELLWQNGQVVMQSQNQRSVKRSNNGDAVTPADQPPAREIRPDVDAAAQIFIQEEEMNSWLHYPIDDASFCRDFYSDLVCSTPAADVPPQSTEAVKTAPPLPPPPPTRPMEEAKATPRFQSFGHFSIPKGKAKESTVMESSRMPVAAAAPESRASHITGAPSGAFFRHGSMSCTAGVTSSAAGGDMETGTYDLTMTSSPGGSGASISASAEPVHMPPPPPVAAEEGRKRKGRGGGDENDYQSEDVDFESLGPKKKGRGSASTKRSRAAEVHNLSERRRRDRINEKMKALQELIPRCNKSDKASMLDEAIEYLKSLQLQVQMMSMGCSMVPMMFPGVQQYMPAMRMGMGMGMGMGMDMGANRPMMPFQSVMPGSGFSTPTAAAAAAAHLGPRFPMQAFNMRPVHMSDPTKVQATTNQPDPMLNSFGLQNPNQARMPNFADPYQQFLGLQQAQVPLPQNQVMMPPSSSGPTDDKEIRL